jgi:hypothetical protein
VSYRVGIKTKHNHEAWVYNQLRFSSIGDARRYGKALKLRWPEVTEFIVEDSVQLPNTEFPVPSDRYAVERLRS